MQKKNGAKKLSYESDGKMGQKKGQKTKENDSANFFNITPSSE